MRFNPAPEGWKTTNHEGHVAYKMGDKERLVTQVLTTFFGEPKFYSKDGDAHEIITTATTVAAVDPQFIANLAVFARKEFNLRSVSHILSAISAHEPKGKELTRRLVSAVVVRADDMTEILSAYIALFKKPIPNSLKKGINDAFARFDEYAIGKYKAEGKALKMRDVLRICHPKPKDDAQAAMWKRCIAGELATPLTWETELSAKGNTKEVWESLIDSGKVGYMALLRNLRNIINTQPSNIQKVFDTLADKDSVLKSKQLPFRFLSAYKELHGVENATSKVFDTLEAAIEASVENIPKIPGKTAIAVDVSGSMCSPVSNKSRTSCADIALLLGILAARVCDESMFFTFDTALYNPAVSSRCGILSQVNALPVNGGGTNISLPFEYLTTQKISVDRILVLSDSEVNSPRRKKPIQSRADDYRRKVNKDTWVHAIDLQGYGTQQFIGGKTNIIAGWSERVLEFIMLAEAGMDNLTKRVNDYTY